MENKLVIDAFNYYDSNKDKDYKKRFYSYKRELSGNDNEKSIITIFDKDENKVLKSEYELIGTYNIFANLWTWGWAELKLPKNVTYTSRKMLHYGLDIMFDKERNNISDLYLKSILTSSDININNQLQLEMLLAISSYLTKIPDIIHIKETVGPKKDDISYEYLLLSNIKLY
jgi:hypothetical protein